MNTTSEITAGPAAIVEGEVRMQRMLIAYILTGLLFLLPVSYTHLTLPTIYSV